MMANTETHTSSKTGRWLLFLSLALNLFLVGLIAGGLVMGRPGPMRDPGALMGLSPMEMRALADNDDLRDKFRDVMKEARRDIGPAMRQSFQARRAISDALKREPYDSEAVATAFTNAQNADRAVRDLSQQAMLEFLDSLNAEERAALIKALDETPGFWRTRRKGMRDGSRFDDDRPRLREGEN